MSCKLFDNLTESNLLKELVDILQEIKTILLYIVMTVLLLLIRLSYIDYEMMMHI